MDCARIDLIAYHFDTSTDEERDAVERHLLGCRRCLEAYLALKRHVEHGARAERPGPEVHARLRGDVERAFRPMSRGRLLAWLARPIPRYQGLAAAAVALAIAVLAPALVERATSPALHGGDRVDTSRPSAESLTIY
jgi:anti-sigma factor RsiW